MAERKIYYSIAELVGETPLVEVTNYEKEHDLDATILAKLEFKDIPGVPELIAEKGLAFDSFYDLLQKYADEHGWYYINQGRNPENPNVHIATTGPEIWDATGGNIDFQYDEVVEVNADLAYEVGRDLVRTDGIFLGQSAAAAIKVATDIAKRPEAKGKTIVAIYADNAFKYLSTNIYR